MWRMVVEGRLEHLRARCTTGQKSKARLFSPLTCSLFSSMADDLDDDFAPDIGGDDAAESVSFLELEQPTPSVVPTKKRKHREKDKQSKVHSLFFVFLSLAYHLLETKAH